MTGQNSVGNAWKPIVQDLVRVLHYWPNEACEHWPVEGERCACRLRQEAIKQAEVMLKQADERAGT